MTAQAGFREYDADKIGGFTTKKTINVTNSTSPYSIGDNLGGILKIDEVLRSLNNTGVIFDICLWSKENNKPELVIDFWQKSPLGTYTDNLAQVIDGDELIWLGCKKIEIADWIDSGVISRVHIPTIGIACIAREINDRSEASRNLYMTIQVNTVITWTNTNSLIVRTGILQD